MPDQNRTPRPERNNVNENEDMHDGSGSSQGTAPGGANTPAAPVRPSNGDTSTESATYGGGTGDTGSR